MSRVPLAICQRRLAQLWLAGSAFVFLLLVVQSVLGKFGGASPKAWAWFLPSVLPSLSLIVGAVAYGATQPTPSDTVDGFAYRMSLWLSGFYLALVAAVPLLQPLVGLPPLKLMEVSSLFLGPVNALVGLALGAFFVSKGRGS